MSATDTTAAEPRRLSIRLPHWGWFLLGTVVLVVGYVGLSVWWPWHREQLLIQKIKSWRGGVTSEAIGPEWLRQAVGERRINGFKIFNRVIMVGLGRSKVTDADMANLSEFRSLEDLTLGGTAVTDAGLVRLSELPNLRALSLDNTAVTNAGLVYLNGCTNLNRLCLWCTAVSDAGLPYLSGLTNLEYLHLSGTAVTDASISHLKKLLNLRVLDLEHTAFTANGIEELRAALPDCRIDH